MEPLSAFVFGVIGVVPRIVTTWVDTRSRMRVERLRAELAEGRDQRNFERSLRLRQANAPAAVATAPASARPAEPQARQRARVEGRPAVVIASLPAHADRSLGAVPHAVRRLLGEIAGIGARAVVVPAERTVAGPVRNLAEARGVAGRFGAQPAVVVYFTVAGGTTTALAHLSTGFEAPGKVPAQAVLIARYSRAVNLPPVVAEPGRLPTYRHINLDALSERSGEDVVAYTVTWFLLALIDAYWRVKHGVDPGLLAQTRSEARPAPVQRRAPSQFLAGAAEQRARLEREAAMLAAAGYTVTAEEITEEYVGLHVEGASGDVIFVVDAEYPATPPVTIMAGGSRIELDTADWTPECTLADIVEALL